MQTNFQIFLKIVLDLPNFLDIVVSSKSETAMAKTFARNTFESTITWAMILSPVIYATLRHVIG